MNKINHIGTNVIETNRLILRKYKIEDAKDVFIYCSDETVNNYPYKNIEETKIAIKSWIEEYKNINHYDWAIELKECNKIIGDIFVLNEDEKNNACEISYVISKTYWNKGYATEALHSVLRYLIINVGYNIIRAAYLIDNPASGKVMEKAGMKYEMTKNQNIYNCKTDEYKDQIIYKIIREDI